LTAPARVTYVYDKACTFCGAAFESRRHDAIQCKRCKWKRRAAAYKARYPEKVLAQHRRWNAMHLDARRAHKNASYWRHVEKNRERNRRYSAAHPKSGTRHPWEHELARSIQQIAMV
jgi:DNA-directed RNA polymerase subunit RPC12/RpoP